ncbi:hypothetical protein PsorP6_012089 [Peronosclerospora sorghi]|uniref:Uncharacterized protein n=1 Tax=Peronosclerospora sorghi TaxID=230839 RepID=A0ACC0WHA4_9STRA|nr:hypothetical protein PsorP6_012089 [Peronosclerospora sorghi]
MVGIKESQIRKDVLQRTQPISQTPLHATVTSTSSTRHRKFAPNTYTVGPKIDKSFSGKINCLKFTLNDFASLSAVWSNAALSYHASLGFKISDGTPFTVVGISKPNSGSFTNDASVMLPSSTAPTHLRVNGSFMCLPTP